MYQPSISIALSKQYLRSSISFIADVFAKIAYKCLNRKLLIKYLNIMGTIVIVIIAVVVIAIIVLAKKGQEDSTLTYGGETSCLKQQEVKVEMQKQLQELVRIGTESLVSLEMTRAEKEDLIGNVIDSIRENTQGYEEEKELVFQIMRKSYADLLSRFSFDKEFCTKLLQRFETFESEIKMVLLKHTVGMS